MTEYLLCSQMDSANQALSQELLSETSEGSCRLKSDKLHRYSFGTVTENG